VETRQPTRQSERQGYLDLYQHPRLKSWPVMSTNNTL
jgi:hypothetical protein